MAGTREGGLKAAANNKSKYGEDFYKRIGRSGGKNGHTGGFNSDVVGPDGATGRERARTAGVVGGKNSRRGVSKRTDVSVATTPEFIPSKYEWRKGIRKLFGG